MKSNQIEDLFLFEEPECSIDYSLVPHLRCPFCKINTPQVQQVYIDKDLLSPFISLSCKCMSESTSQNISLDYYLKFLFSKPICFKHKNKEATFYCDECKLFFCNSCNNYHSVFKKEHLNNSKDLFSNKNNYQKDCNLYELWKVINSKTNINSLYRLEYHISNLLGDFQLYTNKELDIIDQLIEKLKTMKTVLQTNFNLIIKNNSSIVNLLRVLYNDFYTKNEMNINITSEKINNFQRINIADNFISKCDNDYLNEISSHCDKFIKGFKVQQNDFLSRQVFTFNDMELNTFTIGNGTVNSNKQFLSTNDNTNIPVNNELNYITLNYENKKQNSIEINEEERKENKEDLFKFNFDNTQNYGPISPCLSTIKLFDISQCDKDIINNCEDILLNQKRKNSQDLVTPIKNKNAKPLSKEKNKIINKKCVFTFSFKKEIKWILQLRNNESNLNGNILIDKAKGELTLFDESTYKIKESIIYDTEIISAITELIDGRIAIGVSDYSIKVFPIRDQKNMITLIGHNDLIITLKQCNDVLLSSSKDTSIKIWDLLKSSCLYNLTSHTGSVNDLLPINDTDFFSCSDDERILLWNNNKQKKEYKGHKGGVNSLCSIDEKRIASCGCDGAIKIWDIFMNECSFTLKGHIQRVNKIIFIQKENVLVSVSDDKEIRFWDLGKRECIEIIEKAMAHKINLVYELNDKKLITADKEGAIKIWE